VIRERPRCGEAGKKTTEGEQAQEPKKGEPLGREGHGVRANIPHREGGSQKASTSRADQLMKCSPHPQEKKQGGFLIIKGVDCIFGGEREKNPFQKGEKKKKDGVGKGGLGGAVRDKWDELGREKGKPF